MLQENINVEDYLSLKESSMKFIAFIYAGNLESNGGQCSEDLVKDAFLEFSEITEFTSNSIDSGKSKELKASAYLRLCEGLTDSWQ